MGLSNDPFCSYCKEVVESASHFLCHCNYFAVLKTTVWGKPSLHPTDIDAATVGDIVRFIKKSHRFSSSIQWQLESHRGWLMDPHWGLSLRGDATNALPLLEPGTWNICELNVIDSRQQSVPIDGRCCSQHRQLLLLNVIWPDAHVATTQQHESWLQESSTSWTRIFCFILSLSTFRCHLKHFYILFR